MPTLFNKSRHLRSETAPCGDGSLHSREIPTQLVFPPRRERRYSSPVELNECLFVLNDHTEGLDPIIGGAANPLSGTRVKPAAMFGARHDTIVDVLSP